MIQEKGYHALLKGPFKAKEAPYDDIEEQDWLCLDCLEGFVKYRLCTRWLDWKQADGQVIKKNCAYGKLANWLPYSNRREVLVFECVMFSGWDCPTTRQKPEHASKLNIRALTGEHDEILMVV